MPGRPATTLDDTLSAVRSFSPNKSSVAPKVRKAAPPPPSAPAIRLARHGTQQRPNGITYHPRFLGGHEDIAALRLAREKHLPALLTGPPGTGKTAMIEAAFPECETIECTADTTVDDLMGTWATTPGGYEWCPGPVQRAVERNVPLYVDEIAIADSRVLAGLYAVMDGRNVLRIMSNPRLEPIPVRDGFYVVAATNPNAPGARMSEAMLSRFLIQFEVQTDWDLARTLGVNPKAVKVASNLATNVKTGAQMWCPQLRELLAFRDLSKEFGESFALSNLAQVAPPEERDAVVKAIRDVFGDNSITPLALGGQL